MEPLFKIFAWGMLISFLGSLPLGTVNVTATNIAVRSGTSAGVLFSLGCLFIETLCLCTVLAAMDWVFKRQRLFRVFEWFTAVLILIMAAGSFFAAYKMKPFGESVFTSYSLHPFFLGLLLSALNPLHIPFWFGWTTVLINKEVLIPGKKPYLIYVTGITIGTLLGFDVFIYGGNYIVKQLGNKQDIINWVIGIVLLITAFVQLYKMMSKTTVINATIV
ncbi:MAG: LysE family transporter [Panacibacter sp.]